MMDDRRQQLNPAGVAAIPVVTSSTPPEPPPPPSGARPGNTATGPLAYETTQAIEKQLRILGYRYPSVEWDGALAAARAYVQTHPQRRPSMSTVRITTGGLVSTTAVVQVDGHDLAHCTRSFRLEAGVNEVTRLRLDIVARRVAEFDGEAIVGFNRDFEALLVGLGWTPPAAEMGA